MIASPLRTLAALLGSALLLVSVTHAQGDIDPPSVTDTYALTGARVVVAPGQALDPATVVVREGIIEAVGPDAAVPYDARRIPADSLIVYAGFIDGFSHAGVEMPDDPGANSENEGSEEEEREIDPGDPPPDRAGIQPDRSVRPFLSPEESTLQDLRKVGFTAGQVAPEGQMLPGSSAHVLYGGETANDMVLESSPSLFAQLEGASDYVYPATQMAVIAKFRQLYREADRRQTLQAEYEAGQTDRPRPPQDPIHSAFFPVLNGNTPVTFYADDALPIHRVLNLRQELGFPLVLAGLGEGFRTLDALRNTDAPLFLTLDLPEAPKRPVGPDTTVADTTDHPGRYYDPTLRTVDYEDVPEEETNLRLRHALERRRYQSTAATFEEAGLTFGFTTRAADPGDIRGNLRTMIERGLSEDAALAALTTRPAGLLGLDDRLGTVETGKIANLVVTDAPYFEEGSSVRYVFVDGRPYEYDTESESGSVSGDVALVLGTWSYVLETPQGEQTGTIRIEGDQSGLSGTVDPAQGDDRSLRSISFDGSTLSFSVESSSGATLSVSVTVEAGTFEGTATTPNGSFPITGERTESPS